MNRIVMFKNDEESQIFESLGKRNCTVTVIQSPFFHKGCF